MREFDPHTGEVSENGSASTSIAAMAASGEVVDAGPSIRGDGQLTLEVGGEEPSSASLQLSLGAVPAGREWSQGERVRLVVEVRVADVNFKEREDRHGTRWVERVHVGKLERVISAE